MSGELFDRRGFLRKAGIAAGAAVVAPGMEYVLAGITSSVDAMKIIRVEAVTFRKDLKIGGGSGGDDGAEFWWVRLHTDRGLIGYGETYPFQGGEIGALADLAPELLGRDPRDISGLWKYLHHRLTMRVAGGAEMRVLSAINMAQLDILGQAAGLPLYRLLGGKVRDAVKVYNTTTDYWAINETRMGPDTKRIVEFLLERGISAMKIYPFDGEGDYISAAQIERGLKWIRDIRDCAGNRMDICVDCWGRWNLPSAQRIAKALEPFDVLYLEDVMLSNDVDAYAQLAAETTVPVCLSETLASRYQYKEFLESKACDVVMYDLCWVGGPWEAKRISELADAFMIPISPHTCGGPLLYLASIHVSTAVPNFLIMESNYWKYTHQYPYFLNRVPVPDEGVVRASEAPGLGAEIRPELFKSGDAVVKVLAEAG